MTSHRGNEGIPPDFEILAHFSSSAYITRSIAPLGELCSMIGFFLLPSSSTNSIYNVYHFQHLFGRWKVPRPYSNYQ